MNSKFLFLGALVIATSFGCGESTAEDIDESESAASAGGLDNIGAPTIRESPRLRPQDHATC